MAAAPGQVFVVEDDDDIRDSLELILESQGWSTAAARDGQEALERIHAGLSPKLVLLDLRMPRLNGEEFLAAARHDPDLEGVPIIILSGDADGAGRAASLGATDFLAKPIELADLLATVARYAPRSAPPPK